MTMPRKKVTASRPRLMPLGSGDVLGRNQGLGQVRHRVLRRPQPTRVVVLVEGDLSGHSHVVDGLAGGERGLALGESMDHGRTLRDLLDVWVERNRVAAMGRKHRERDHRRVVIGQLRVDGGLVTRGVFHEAPRREQRALPRVPGDAGLLRVLNDPHEVRLVGRLADRGDRGLVTVSYTHLTLPTIYSV